MKWIALMFNLFIISLVNFSSFNCNQENVLNVNLFSNVDCDVHDSIVNITTKNNLLNGSGIVISEDDNRIYIATSSAYYSSSYNYEIIFNDFTRKEANVVGVAKEDEILILSVAHANLKYCLAKLSKSELIDDMERVSILGKYKAMDIKTNTTIDSVGVTRNNLKDGYARYYYSLISEDLDVNFLGGAVVDKSNQLLGIIVSKSKEYRKGTEMLDVDKLVSITSSIVNLGYYQKKYLKSDLLDVKSLSSKDKYLYSLNEDALDGVLVSSVHYLNYFIGGLNLGMVILDVNGEIVENCYKLDNILNKYHKNDIISLKVRTITGNYRTIKTKL